MSEAAVTIPETQLARVKVLGAITAIENAEAEIVAVDGLAFIQTVLRNLEKARKELTTPLNDRVKAINTRFREITDPIDITETKVKDAILDWRRREKARVDAEQLRVKRENDERERLAKEQLEHDREEIEAKTFLDAMAAAFTPIEAVELAKLEAADVVAPAVLKEVAPAPVPTMTKGTIGAAVARKVWKFRVTDPALVPRAYLAVDETVIRKAMNEGVRQIPGVEFFEEEQLAGRRAS